MARLWQALSLQSRGAGGEEEPCWLSQRLRHLGLEVLQVVALAIEIGLQSQLGQAPEALRQGLRHVSSDEIHGTTARGQQLSLHLIRVLQAKRLCSPSQSLPRTIYSKLSSSCQATPRLKMSPLGYQACEIGSDYLFTWLEAFQRPTIETAPDLFPPGLRGDIAGPQRFFDRPYSKGPYPRWLLDSDKSFKLLGRARAGDVLYLMRKGL